ncbi:MAG: hypothetical protein KIT79_03710 [Deltaproteobacteria bacterium]|nr:hypothetical protein [Deltaproteobacteria bacterium]
MAPPKKRLGEILIEANAIDEMQLKTALSEQKRWGDRLGNVLIALGFVDEGTMAKALSSHLKIPSVNLTKQEIPAEIIAMLDAERARKFGVIPVMFKKEGTRKTLYLAMSDPTNLPALDEIGFASGCQIKPVVAVDSQIQAMLAKHYGGADTFERSYGVSTGFRGGTDADAGYRLQQEMMDRSQNLEPAPARREPPPAPSPAGDGGRPRPSKEMLALIRILSRKGIITKEEFIEEFRNL